LSHTRQNDPIRREAWIVQPELAYPWPNIPSFD
jgi:hypothetical protein